MEMSTASGFLRPGAIVQSRLYYFVQPAQLAGSQSYFLASIGLMHAAGVGYGIASVRGL